MNSSISEQASLPPEPEPYQQPNAIISRQPYHRLWLLCQIVVSGLGLAVTAVTVILLLSHLNVLATAAVGFAAIALFLLYVGGELVPLTFRGVAMSLSFPVALLAHLLAMREFPQAVEAAAAAVILGVILGSFLSECVRWRWRYNWWPWRRAAWRIFYYSAHCGLAAFIAAMTYIYVAQWPSFYDLQSFHLQATLAYTIAYALLSHALVWPHDWLSSYLLVPPDEERLPRVSLMTALLITPVPLVIFHFSQGQSLPFLVLIPFVLFLYLIRSYTDIEEREQRLQAEDRLRRELGAPANMAELMRRMAHILDRLVIYQWAAFYSSETGSDMYHLRAKLEEGKHPEHFKPPFTIQETHVLAPIEAMPDQTWPNTADLIHWPLHVIKGHGHIGEVVRSGERVAAVEIGSHAHPLPNLPYMPLRTAFIYFPIAHKNTTIGLLALARSNRKRFRENEQTEVTILVDAIGSMLRSVQQREEELERLFGRLENFTGNPELIQQAMRQLTERGVDMAKILNAISTHTFQGNLKAVLHSVVSGNGRADNKELSLSRDQLTMIYRQVRDESPEMPPLNDEILDLLAVIPSSLNLAFSFRYRWPELSRGQQFTELYRFFSKALEIESVKAMVGLRPLIRRALDSLQERGAVDPKIVVQLNHLDTVLISLQQVANSAEDDVVPGPQEYLNQALEKIAALEQAILTTLDDPERFIFLNLIANWQVIITRHLDAVEQGGAILETNLRQNYALAVPDEPVTAVLQLKNNGQGVAHRVIVKLVDSPDYHILSASIHDLGVLSPDSSKEFIFEITPRVEKALRLNFQINYRDRERGQKRIAFADVLHLRDSPPPFIEIENPYVAGPALDTGSHIFFGREDVFKFIEQNSISHAQQQRVLLLISERRMGKTSILKQLPVRLKDKNYVHVFLDCQAIGIDPGTTNFFLSLAGAIADGLEEVGIHIDLPTYGQMENNPRFVFEREFLARVWQLIGDRRLMIAVDEYEVLEQRVDEGKLDQEIILYLRSLIQHNNRLAFIFAGTHALEQLTVDYWHVLFNIAKYQRVGFLDNASARQLMTEPVRQFNMVYDDLALDEMLRGTGGHPFFLQSACDHVITLCNQQKRNYVTIQQVQDALERIVESGRPHLEFIWQHSLPAEQAALAGLATALANNDQPTVQIIIGVLEKAQQPYQPQEMRAALESLEDRFIVARKQRGKRGRAYYDFTASLYRMWIRKYHALD